MKAIFKLKQALEGSGQPVIGKAVNLSKRLNAVRAGSGHFEFFRSLPSCLFCCSNDNVFFCSANVVPFLFCTHSAAHEREK